MGYRGSLLKRIAGTVLLAFAWFALLLTYLTFASPSGAATDLMFPLLAGILDAGAIGTLWVVWFLRDRRAV